MGGFRTDSFLARPRRKTFLVDFVAKWMVMVTYFGSVLFPSLQHVRDLPEFASLVSLGSQQVAPMFALAWVVAWT